MQSVAGTLQIGTLIVEGIHIRIIYTEGIPKTGEALWFTPALTTVRAGYHEELVIPALLRGGLKHDIFPVSVTGMGRKIYIRKVRLGNQWPKIRPVASILADRIGDS